MLDDLAEIGRLSLLYQRYRLRRLLSSVWRQLFYRRQKSPDRVLAEDMRLLVSVARRLVGDVLVLQHELPLILVALDSIIQRHEELSRGTVDENPPFRETMIVIPNGMPKNLPHRR